LLCCWPSSALLSGGSRSSDWSKAESLRMRTPVLVLLPSELQVVSLLTERLRARRGLQGSLCCPPAARVSPCWGPVLLFGGAGAARRTPEPPTARRQHTAAASMAAAQKAGPPVDSHIAAVAANMAGNWLACLRAGTVGLVDRGTRSTAGSRHVDRKQNTPATAGPCLHRVSSRLVTRWARWLLTSSRDLAALERALRSLATQVILGVTPPCLCARTRARRGRRGGPLQPMLQGDGGWRPSVDQKETQHSFRPRFYTPTVENPRRRQQGAAARREAGCRPHYSSWPGPTGPSRWHHLDARKSFRRRLDCATARLLPAQQPPATSALAAASPPQPPHPPPPHPCTSHRGPPGPAAASPSVGLAVARRTAHRPCRFVSIVAFALRRRSQRRAALPARNSLLRPPRLVVARWAAVGLRAGAHAGPQAGRGRWGWRGAWRGGGWPSGSHCRPPAAQPLHRHARTPPVRGFPPSAQQTPAHAPAPQCPANPGPPAGLCRGPQERAGGHRDAPNAASPPSRAQLDTAHCRSASPAGARCVTRLQFGHCDGNSHSGQGRHVHHAREAGQRPSGGDTPLGPPQRPVSAPSPEPARPIPITSELDRPPRPGRRPQPRARPPAALDRQHASTR
jgi:hypothetical protein